MTCPFTTRISLSSNHVVTYGSNHPFQIPEICNLISELAMYVASTGSLTAKSMTCNLKSGFSGTRHLDTPTIILLNGFSPAPPRVTQRILDDFSVRSWIALQ